MQSLLLELADQLVSIMREDIEALERGTLTEYGSQPSGGANGAEAFDDERCFAILGEGFLPHLAELRSVHQKVKEQTELLFSLRETFVPPELKEANRIGMMFYLIVSSARCKEMEEAVMPKDLVLNES